MNCPKCSTVVESGAAFCGNCGQAIAQPIAAPGIPNYAITTPVQHKGETKALLALLFGVFGLVGTLFMAVIGLVLGIAGVIMGTMSRSSPKRALSTAGLAMSSLSIIAGLAVMAYAISRDLAAKDQPEKAEAAKVATIHASDLSTPCYSVDFIDELKISHNKNSCNMNAFDGNSLEDSTVAYKVYSSQSEVTTTSAFNTLAQKALRKDIKETLPTFTLDREEEFIFAGSPAYAAYAYDKENNVSLIEAAVLHKSPTGDNIFILVHAVNKDKIDLQTLESQWQWK